MYSINVSYLVKLKSGTSELKTIDDREEHNTKSCKKALTNFNAMRRSMNTQENLE